MDMKGERRGIMNKGKLNWREIGEKIKNELNLAVKFDESMANYTTFCIGGLARVFVEAGKTEDLVSLVAFCIKNCLGFFVLGGGSNILLSDNGFEGVVIYNRTSGIKILGFSGKGKAKQSFDKEVLIEVASGVSFNRLVRYLLEEEISGLEVFLGLPGTVGGAVSGNAHYENKFIADYLCQAEVVDERARVRKISGSNLSFSYNKSFLSDKNWVLSKAVFKLKFGEKDKLWARANKAVEMRKKTQPSGGKSAGCVFGNVVADGKMIPAGHLLDRAGLKGERVGKAVVSDKHANFIINENGAAALDVLKLIKICKKKVKEKFGFDLTEEIKLIGF